MFIDVAGHFETFAFWPKRLLISCSSEIGHAETTMPDDTQEELIDRLNREGEQALAELFERFQPRLQRMVELRLHPKLCGRVDAADVLQETYLEAAKRLHRYLSDPSVPVFVWMRGVVCDTLTHVHRRHLGAKKRDVGQEVSIHRHGYPLASSVSLAAHLVGRLTSPSQAAIRAETMARLEDALDQMDEIDREVLALRHFEQLGNNEVAAILGLNKAAASQRYMRALARLKDVLSAIPDCES